MAAPYQVVTSTATTALDYAPQQRIVTLCDGSLLTVDYDGGTSAKLTRISNPSGTSPTMTAVAQSFSMTSATNLVASLFVLHNGTTSDDVWVAYSSNTTSPTGLYVAHGTFTASGATWSWDNTGTSIGLGTYTGGFMLPTLIWTGTYLIVATRAFATAGWDVAIAYTTTQNGSSGWSALTAMETSTSSSHDYPTLLHDASNGCTLLVYSMNTDVVYARVLPDTSSPALANWSARVALSGTVGVGAANLTATLDATNLKLHVAWCDSTASPNPHYVVSTYTTTSITAGTAYAITGGGGTGATSPALGLDAATPPSVYLFWASAAAGAASDISYVTIASPYASGNVSSVTNQTAASANDNVWPHIPQQEPMSGGYVPLIYLRSVTSPFPIEFDNTIAAGVTGASVTLVGESDGVASGSAALAVTHALVGESDGVATASATLTTLPAGTGIGDLTVTTKSQTWSGGPSGSPGTETDVTYQDASGGGWSVGLIPTYGGMPISSWYEVDAATAGANQTGLTTSTPDGHIHWLEQNASAGFAGSEDLPFTLTEQAPTGTAFRRYYKTSFGPDANGFNWNASACIYPGDPGFIAYRFDCVNPTASAITLAGSDGMEIALIGGLQQSDSTWAPANGFYGAVAGSPTTGWPSALTSVDPDYVGITPAGGSGVAVGVATIKQKAVTALSPAWSGAQIQYLQNASRLKLKVQGTLSSFPGSTTSTVYLLNVRRRALTAADAAAMAADYQAPGTPSMTAGTYTVFSYDQRAYTFAAAGSGASNALGATLDLSPTHVTIRYKPVLKVTGWTGGTPQLTWGGSPLTAGLHYRHLEDVTNSILYIQLYFDVVASGAGVGQRNNAALSITPLWVAEADGVATASATLSVSHALVGASAGAGTALAALTVSHPLSGESDGVATATAALINTDALSGEADGVASGAVALTNTDALTGESDGVATATATLTPTAGFVGESDGVASGVVALTISHPLSGASAGVATAVAALGISHPLSGAATGAASASAALGISHPLSGESDGAATAQVALTISHPLSGESDGLATAQATLGSITRGFAGESDGVASGAAALTSTQALAGNAAGLATAVALLLHSVVLAGIASGVGSGAATLTPVHALRVPSGVFISVSAGSGAPGGVFIGVSPSTPSPLASSGLPMDIPGGLPGALLANVPVARPIPAGVAVTA